MENSIKSEVYVTEDQLALHISDYESHKAAIVAQEVESDIYLSDIHKDFDIVSDFVDTQLCENKQLATKLKKPVVDDTELSEIAVMKHILTTTHEALSAPVSTIIRHRVTAAGDHFYSNSNISKHIRPGEISDLIDEATVAFEGVLDTLVIDRENDPNAIGTARRLAKMYINELMEGRYTTPPPITAFPNTHTGKETGFNGLLVVRSEIKSMCSHHHQIVDGIAYIGIIPREKVIGLSKYTRLAQHLARRGTLQEELAEDIATGIIEATGSDDVAVYIEATHGCCQNRGIMANNSSTQTTVLHGDFLTDPAVRKEFHDNVMFQKLNK